MAAPTSTVLQATKRATRYWPLYSQVQAAVTAVFSSQPGAHTAATKDPLDDINSLPGQRPPTFLVLCLEGLAGTSNPIKLLYHCSLFS